MKNEPSTKSNAPNCERADYDYLARSRAALHALYQAEAVFHQARAHTVDPQTGLHPESRSNHSRPSYQLSYWSH